MAKQPKIAQTDYTRGGRDISNTAIPLYQKNLTQLGDYMDNIQNRLDPYLGKYGDIANAAQHSDLIRKYQRAMGDATANNYAATSGGYSSLNQLGYDDQQRYYNDLAARMYGQQVAQASELANQEWQMLAQTPSVYNQAYALGKEYSDIDRYNQMVDKTNKNWMSNLLTSAGDTIGSISMKSGNPWVMAIGGAVGGTMGTAGRMTGYDTSSLDSLRNAAIGSNNYGGRSNQGVYSGQGDTQTNKNVAGGLTSLFNQYDWFNKNPFSSGSSGLLSGGGLTSSGGSGVMSA